METASSQTAGAAIARVYEQFILPTYSPALALVRGAGCHVWDADGNRYLDLTAGIAVNVLGHAHPALVQAISQQAARLIHVSNNFYNERQAELGPRLAAVAGGDWSCFFCNSGAEANEALIKLARRWGRDRGRYRVVTLLGSFHGRTLATLTATGQEKVKEGFQPLPDGFAHVPAGDLAALERAVTSDTAAVLVEAVQGEGGIIVLDPEYLRQLRQFCDRRELLLFVDEVQTGMGRTGSWFAWQQTGVRPDAFSLAKGLGGGVPIGAAVVDRRLRAVLGPGTHASTFGGNPLATAAALAVIDTIEREGLAEHARALGAWMLAELGRLAGRHPIVKDVRGKGLMIGLLLDAPVRPLLDRLRAAGVLALAAGERVLRLVPPLVLTQAEAAQAIAALERCLGEWAAAAAGADTAAARA